jgi:acyl carrier protein
VQALTLKNDRADTHVRPGATEIDGGKPVWKGSAAASRRKACQALGYRLSDPRDRPEAQAGMTGFAEQLSTFIAEETGMSPDEFGQDTKLFSDGYVDSFIMTAIICYIEDTFELSIEQSDVTLANFDTVASMAAFVQSQKG